jgi:hypothetical protein
MKNIRTVNLIIALLLFFAFNFQSTEILAQNRYSVDQKMEKRKIKRSPEQKAEDRIVEKALKKKEKEKKQREKLQNKNKRHYAKKVSGAGDELVDGKKVYRRMKKSKRYAEKNSSRKKPFWKRN